MDFRPRSFFSFFFFFQTGIYNLGRRSFFEPLGTDWAFMAGGEVSKLCPWPTCVASWAKEKGGVLVHARPIGQAAGV